MTPEALVDLILAKTRDGDELWSETTRGPETEDTLRWMRTADGVEVWEDSVYPAMAALPSVLRRTLTLAEARAELLTRAQSCTPGLLAWYAEHWSKR